MERDGNSMKTIKLFRNRDIEGLEWDIRIFLNINYEKVDLVNVNVTYNTDEEEYIAIVIYYVTDRLADLQEPEEFKKYLEDLKSGNI